ncbi:MAG: TIGR00730 family Rossman fold protein [Paludibacter sp.]|nr:TIGR00730 family Rossman fold protein [Paludibacter sp.]
MKIAVFCSSSNHIANQYKKVAFQLGEFIAESGNTLVYGGATGGLMDSVSEGAHSKNGEIIGVIPNAVIKMNRQSSLPTNLITVETMSERKAEMKVLTDIFVVLPGSYGTLDEMLDIVASGVVGEHKKPLIILNQNGFYDLFLSQIDLMRTESFIPLEEKYKPIIVSEINQCIELIKLSNKNS